MKSTRKPRPKETGTLIGVRLQPAPLAALDAFAAAQPEPAPSRPEAVRRALTEHLRAKGYLPSRDDPTGHIDRIG